MTDKNTQKIMEILAERIRSGDLTPMSPEEVAALELVQQARAVKQQDWERFAKRGYKFGTVTEAWEALRNIPKAIKAQKVPDREVLQWLSAAIVRCKEDDPTELIRQLGLRVHGRHRTVNPDEVAFRVDELIKGGATIMNAAKQAASEIGCSEHAAYRWHRAVFNVKSDSRRK